MSIKNNSRLLRVGASISLLAAVSYLVAMPFIAVPPSHRSSQRALNGIWVHCASLTSGEGRILEVDGNVQIGGRVVECATTNSLFVWHTHPKSGGVVLLKTADHPVIEQRIFIVSSGSADSSGRRWFLFNDGTIEFLGDDDVDWSSQEKHDN